VVAVTGEPAGGSVRIVDSEAGSWFLIEWEGALHLEARYMYSAFIDDAALIHLDDAELAAYERGGHDYLTDLAERVHTSAPYLPTSKFHGRNIYLREGMRGLRREVTAAIIAARKANDARA
jgi:hypothetical protein